MNKEIMYAHNVLKAVYFDDAYSSIELNKLLQNSAVEKLNKNLITKIVYGVLEKDILLSYVISKFCSKKPDEKVELLLKIGAYILKFVSGIPNFACVNEIVELCKKNCSKYVAGFVNAVLKKIDNNEVLLPDKERDLINYLSVKYSYPVWFVKKMLKVYSVEFVENLLSYSLTTLTHVRIVESNISVQEFKNVLQKNAVHYENSPVPYGLYVDYSELLKVKNLDKCYAVQGVPSIIVCENALKYIKNNVLDVCSAPGGKAVLLATKNNQCEIIGCDIHENRVKLIKEYAKKYSITNIKTMLNDATKLNKEWLNCFDVVLCDVPCSNLGVCNKKPDVLLRKTEGNVTNLISIQKNILETSANYVKKGGVLIYSTCTILPDENENVLFDFLSKHEDFELIDIDTIGIEVINKQKTSTFIPSVSGTEGFFVGGIIRK